jgi:hypothetical protein
MKKIDKECAGGDCVDCTAPAGTCRYQHRYWPTPEQFEQEYGRKPLRCAYFVLKETGWDYGWWPGKSPFIGVGDPENIVIACTPAGAPPRNWRPE